MIVGENCRAFVTILLAAASLDAWPVLVNCCASRRVKWMRSGVTVALDAFSSRQVCRNMRLIMPSDSVRSSKK